MGGCNTQIETVNGQNKGYLGDFGDEELALLFVVGSFWRSAGAIGSRSAVGRHFLEPTTLCDDAWDGEWWCCGRVPMQPKWVRT